jgi:hypothetical protein
MSTGVGAESKSNSDLVGPFGNRHEHGVHHADTTHQQRDCRQCGNQQRKLTVGSIASLNDLDEVLNAKIVGFAPHDIVAHGEAAKKWPHWGDKAAKKWPPVGVRCHHDMSALGWAL